MSTAPLLSTAPLAEMVGLAGQDLSGLIAGLSRRGVTVACAESLTGGLLTALLTEIPGASAVVRGGLIVYATDLKHLLAGVDARLLADSGPVDPVVAVALADGARRVCRAQIGIGLTGVAGPDPQNGIAVGTWYVAIAGTTADGVDIGKLVQHLPGDDLPGAGDPGTPAMPQRDRVRNAAVRAAVALLTELVRQH